VPESFFFFFLGANNHARQRNKTGPPVLKPATMFQSTRKLPTAEA
jgi:hypothetical protein